MPAYLSPEWVAAFNAALTGLDLTEALAAAGDTSLTASEGDFAVAQVVTDAPGGEVRTVLRVADGAMTLTLDPDGSLPAHVTIVLGYDDARAMARGELDPADALAAGRVRIRGELAVLVAAQGVLTAAGDLLGSSLADVAD